MDSWYTILPGDVDRRFIACLAGKWRGVRDQRRNSKRPFVSANVVLTQKRGTRQAKEIRARIFRPQDLWEIGSHASLVGDTESRKGRVVR